MYFFFRILVIVLVWRMLGLHWTTNANCAPLVSSTSLQISAVKVCVSLIATIVYCGTSGHNKFQGPKESVLWNLTLNKFLNRGRISFCASKREITGPNMSFIQRPMTEAVTCAKLSDNPPAEPYIALLWSKNLENKNTYMLHYTRMWNRCLSLFSACGCSGLAVSMECDAETGRCVCEEGAIGPKCDDCAFGFTGT